MDKVQPGDKCEEKTCWDVPERDAVITCDERRKTRLCDRCYNEGDGECGECKRKKRSGGWIGPSALDGQIDEMNGEKPEWTNWKKGEQGRWVGPSALDDEKKEMPKGMVKIKTAEKKKEGPIVWRKRGDEKWKKMETKTITEPDGTKSIIMIDREEDWNGNQERSSSSRAKPER